MKKQKLKPSGEQYHDFSIFSISTTLADYMLAFHLNNLFGLKLARQADLPVYLSGEQALLFSLYYFMDDLHSEFHLIQDISSSDQMMNSYLYILKGYFPEPELEKIVDNIGKLNDIFSVNHVDPGRSHSNKSKVAKTTELINTILTDLEYHMIELGRLRDEAKIKLKPAPYKPVRKLYN
ncbi:MAG: hypothetical protein K9H16_05105 [Bacteroidales bacterium]|nr:hypothetical protein [Bacteroidales bacterium]